MTKTLTEQWRDGTLEQRYYYVKYFPTVGKPFIEIEPKNFLLDLVKVKDRDKIEVLATVPDYDKVKEMSQKVERLEFDNDALEMVNNESVTNCHQLEKKLEIATKALEELETKSDKFDNSWSMQEQLDFIKAKCQETLYQLKEMEGVK